MARGADLNAGNGAIERIAAEHGVTPAQVILRWHIENGTIIIPKSVHAGSAEAESRFVWIRAHP